MNIEKGPYRTPYIFIGAYSYLHTLCNLALSHPKPFAEASYCWLNSCTGLLHLVYCFDLDVKLRLFFILLLWRGGFNILLALPTVQLLHFLISLHTSTRFYNISSTYKDLRFSYRSQCFFRFHHNFMPAAQFQFITHYCIVKLLFIFHVNWRRVCLLCSPSNRLPKEIYPLSVGRWPSRATGRLITTEERTFRNANDLHWSEIIQSAAVLLICC